MRASALVEDITIRAQSVGVNETTAATEKLGRATQGTIVAVDQMEKRQLSLAAARDRLNRQIDVGYRLQRQYDTGLKVLNSSLSANQISTEAYNRSLGLLDQKFGANAHSADRFAVANDNLKGGLSSISMVVGGLVGTLVAYAGSLLLLAAGAAKIGMEMQALERGFAASAGSAQQGGREFNFIRDQSDRLGLSLGETAKQYMQMVAASQGTALQGQATRDVFIGVVTAMTALGKGSEETGRALTAVQQMMSKGKVASEELKGQLGEVLPGAFNLAAQSVGKTTAEFSKMLDDGDILASDLLPKLAARLKEMYGAAAAQGAEGLQANLNRLKTAWNDYANEVAGGGLNDALNRAAQAMARFLKSLDGAEIGQRLGGVIDWIVQALERVPRGFENMQIGIQIVRDLAREFAAWWAALEPVKSAMAGVGESSIEAASVTGEAWKNGINTAIGVSVGGVQMIGAAFSALPAVMSEIAINAANALIKGIESGVNAAIELVNKLIMQVNSALSLIPGSVAGTMNTIAPIAFKPLENASAGATEKILGDLKEIGAKATSTDYLGAIGQAGKAGIDDLRNRFKGYREAADDAAREQNKFNSMLKQGRDTQAQAATATKKLADATKDGGGAAKGAASAYDNLIQRTKDRIEELELEAQYASKTATEVIKLKLAHDLERAAKKDGRTVTDAMRQDWDKLGEALAGATQRMEAARLAQRQLKEGFDFATDAWKGFAESILTGSDGINGALKSIGKAFLSSSLDALFNGKGGLAALTGLAPASKDAQGGIFGLLTALPKDIRKATVEGTKEGAAIGSAAGITAANDNIAWLGGISGKDLAGGLTAIAGLAGAYGSGMAAGSYAQAVGGGALSGGMGGLALAGTGIGASLGGAAVLGPIGLIAGAALGYFGQQQARKQAKEERQRQAQENYEKAKPEIVKFGSQLRGDAQGTLSQQFEEAMATTRNLGGAAFFAGKYDEEAKLWADLATYKTRIYTEFAASYQGFVDALNMGVGPGGAFNTARDAVKSLGDQLKVFVANTDEVYGAGSAAAVQARQAAASYALSTLVGSKELSTVATRMEEIRGVGAGLTQVLKDLGMEASVAAQAIQDATTVALSRLKETFESDLLRRTSEAQGYGYVNEVGDLLKEFATMQKDAAALGSDPALVANYFRAAAQEIVDGAQLTGSAFDNLLKQFPELVGNVSEFTGALKGAAREADIAARKLSYQDRLFSATNDSSTLAGQLAAYDRAAVREREKEIKSGGEAILELEMAQAAERFNIIRDWNQKALDDQKRAAEEAQSWFEGQAKRIRDYLDGLKAGPETSLSPAARLAEAQSQFDAMYAKALTGDRDSMSGITGSAEQLREAAKAMFASNPQYQAVYQQILARLEALPAQVSAEQFIVDAIEDSRDALVAATAAMQIDLRTSLTAAIGANNASAFAAALNAHFTMLDSSVNGLLDLNELLYGLGPLATSNEQAWARQYLAQIDADGDGQISKMEAVRAATSGIQTNTGQTSSKVDTSNSTLGQLQQVLFNQITHNTAATAEQVAWANNHLLVLRDLTDRARANLKSQNDDRFIPDKGIYKPVPSYADGGWVSGPGTGTSDSINARVSNGEFIMRAAAADRFGGMLDYMNDNLRLPPMPVGVMPIHGGAGNSEMVAELRALRAEVRQLRAEARRNGDIAAAGHERTAAAVDENTDAVKLDTKSRPRQIAGRAA